MGFSIYIGDGRLVPVEQDEDDPFTTPYSRMIGGQVVYFRMRVAEVKQPDVPTFTNDKLTGNSNNRHSSYSAWSDFCEETGLDYLFFDKTYGIMREHPGCSLLGEDHARSIATALHHRRCMYPDTQPGFDTGQDYHLARLIWLDWWVRWALNNCEHAAIENW